MLRAGLRKPLDDRVTLSKKLSASWVRYNNKTMFWFEISRDIWVQLWSGWCAATSFLIFTINWPTAIFLSNYQHSLECLTRSVIRSLLADAWILGLKCGRDSAHAIVNALIAIAPTVLLGVGSKASLLEWIRHFGSVTVKRSQVLKWK